MPAKAVAHDVKKAAAERLAGLATPAGALGRLGDTAVWLAGVTGSCPPPAPANVRAVIFAGDHGVSEFGVSAYPREITALMVDTFVAGRAGVSVLAKQHGVSLRVLDIGVDVGFGRFSRTVSAHKIRRSSGAIQFEDALSRTECENAVIAGMTIAAEEIAAGADLLIGGDMGIGNTTPSAALIAACLGLPAGEVTGRGTGVDGGALAHKESVIQEALDRAGDRVEDPIELLAALGGADLAAGVGFLVGAARAGVPVLLDGLISVAEAVVAERIAPGATEWFLAGHRSTEPAQSLALAKMGLEPLLDLGMRLGEGSGAMAAVPLVRSAAAVLTDMALLADLLG
ncbi:nicotinate-nucleotide--dimethylbenzimidazole phosphoribosyltransferase [Nakamurella silvestris]|nr:nicotinate-nucleotide--dimethylbenzimidazole phosphoribosyltransferase [Nakamurella silvestris]